MIIITFKIVARSLYFLLVFSKLSKQTSIYCFFLTTSSIERLLLVIIFQYWLTFDQKSLTLADVNKFRKSKTSLFLFFKQLIAFNLSTYSKFIMLGTLIAKIMSLSASFSTQLFDISSSPFTFSYSFKYENIAL